jgi:5-methylcytosine-specific restriction endonuclease McrA
MSRVLVVDTQRRPLHPCTPARARLLLKQGKAAVLRRWCPITALSMELVKFDMALIQDPTLHGEAYQQGTLFCFELRAYVLCKWKHACAYCGATNAPLELDHVIPRSCGGSDRESNRVPACHKCNQRKGNHSIQEFLQARPAALQRIQAHLKTPLAGAAAVNTLRWALYERLQATGLPVEVGSGGRTKWNRVSRGLPKTHWLDAAAVGASTPAALYADRVTPWLISATGQQRRQMCLVDEDGFPRTRAKASSRVRGFQAGDMVRAIVPKGKKAGAYVGRVAVRASGSCNITTKVGTIEGVSAKYMRTIHCSDGYRYTQKGRRLLPTP